MTNEMMPGAVARRWKAIFCCNLLFQVVLDLLSKGKLFEQVLRGLAAILAVKVPPRSERQSTGAKLAETRRLPNDHYSEAHTSRRIVGCVFMAIASLLLGACASIGPDPRDLRIETSVSSDGQWIAVLKNAGTNQSQVKVMRMDERKWTAIKAPARTSSIRFGLSPAQLLLTSWKSSENSAAELSAIDVSRADYSRNILYQGYGLGYPDLPGEFRTS
jgi:hypothetical protein